MFLQPDSRPLRRLPDIRDLASGVAVSALVLLLAIVMAGGSGAGMGTPSATPYMRIAEHEASLCDAVLDPIHPAVGAQHLRSCLARF
jgi:hypothetical protein